MLGLRAAGRMVAGLATVQNCRDKGADDLVANFACHELLSLVCGERGAFLKTGDECVARIDVPGRIGSRDYANLVRFAVRNDPNRLRLWLLRMRSRRDSNPQSINAGGHDKSKK